VAVLGILIWFVIGCMFYVAIFRGIWRSIYHSRIRDQVRDLSMEMITCVRGLARQHWDALSIRMGKYELSLERCHLPRGAYTFDAELAEFFISHIQINPEYQRLRDARQALMQRPKVDHRMIYPTFAPLIVTEADMFNVFRQWCKDNVTPSGAATYSNDESGFGNRQPFVRTSPEFLLLWDEWGKWSNKVIEWDGCNSGELFGALVSNRKVEKPW
jgi:hypothetical protein